MINDILDLAKIESGKLQIDQNPFDLPHFLKSLESLFAKEFNAKGLSFTVNIAPDLPHFIIGDALRLNQILINLLSNSLKFTHQGGVDLHVKSLGEENGQVTLLFTVIDTGIGIATESQEKIFKSFAQADLDIHFKYGGTGLGLNISQRLVELMGSKIDLVSQLGQGSQFSFPLTLPTTEDPHLGKEVDPTHIDLTGLTVLVVDDNKLSKMLVEKMLSRVGVQLGFAENGAEALDILAKKDFDLVLMDIRMPVMNGLEATEAIRAGVNAVRNPAIPIVAMTANAFAEDKVACLACGMNGYIAKPVKPQLLYQILTNYHSPN